MQKFGTSSKISSEFLSVILEKQVQTDGYINQNEELGYMVQKKDKSVIQHIHVHKLLALVKSWLTKKERCDVVCNLDSDGTVTCSVAKCGLNEDSFIGKDINEYKALIKAGNLFFNFSEARSYGNAS